MMPFAVHLQKLTLSEMPELVGSLNLGQKEQE